MKVLIAGGSGYIGNGCGRLIFSSSAAIYRASAGLTVDEDSPIDPQSPYARTKAVCEAMFATIRDAGVGIRLRPGLGRAVAGVGGDPVDVAVVEVLQAGEPLVLAVAQHELQGTG